MNPRLRGNDKVTTACLVNTAAIKGMNAMQSERPTIYFTSTNSNASRLGPSIITARVSPNL